MQRNRTLIFVSLAFLFLETILVVFADRPLSEYLHNLDQQNKGLVDIFRAYTDLGKSKWYLWPSAAGIIICLLGLRVKSLSKTAHTRLQQSGEFLLFLFICVAASGIFTDIIKPILGRARPVELTQEGLYGFHPLSFAARWNSMPSGHATTGFALAFVIASSFPRLRIPVFAFGFILAVSRIMVNAHYLSDVLAGGMIAFLTVQLFLWLKTHDGIDHINKRIFPID